MDPNEMLNTLRGSYAEFCLAAEQDDIKSQEAADDGARLIAHGFASLDEWLTRGGFLPSDWAKKQDGMR